jgi:hypothetical protein
MALLADRFAPVPKTIGRVLWVFLTGYRLRHGQLPAMIASSRDHHAYRSQGHVPGDLIPIANTNHFTILDELRQPNSTLIRVVIAMAHQTA